MKKTMLVLATVLMMGTISLANPETTASPSAGETIDQPGIFGYSRGRQQRQNSVDRINRRTKRINRRNGIGLSEEPAQIDWVLINVQLPQPLLAYQLRLEVSGG